MLLVCMGSRAAGQLVGSTGWQQWVKLHMLMQMLQTQHMLRAATQAAGKCQSSVSIWGRCLLDGGALVGSKRSTCRCRWVTGQGVLLVGHSAWRLHLLQWMRSWQQLCVQEQVTAALAGPLSPAAVGVAAVHLPRQCSLWVPVAGTREGMCQASWCLRLLLLLVVMLVHSSRCQVSVDQGVGWCHPLLLPYSSLILWPVMICEVTLGW
jgi:hypothetical protein